VTETDHPNCSWARFPARYSPSNSCSSIPADVIVFGYNIPSARDGGPVKQSEFVRWLARQGATFEEGTKHLKVYLNGQMTHLPRHPAKELKKPLVEGVKKKLNLK
jgi:mRNA interferase HicA